MKNTRSENKSYIDHQAIFQELHGICSHLLEAVSESQFSFPENDYRELFVNARWLKYHNTK